MIALIPMIFRYDTDISKRTHHISSRIEISKVRGIEYSKNIHSKQPAIV